MGVDFNLWQTNFSPPTNAAASMCELVI